MNGINKNAKSLAVKLILQQEIYIFKFSPLINEIYYQNPNHNPQGILESNSTKAIP